MENTRLFQSITAAAGTVWITSSKSISKPVYVCVSLHIDYADLSNDIITMNGFHYSIWFRMTGQLK